MTDLYTDELLLEELAADPGRVLGKGATNASLHYCSPAHGGWGVVKVALLVPESYLVFVCPSACGRHGAIAAIEQGYRNKIGYLCISDNEIILGGYEEEIERGVREVMNRVKPRPKALMVFVSCIDDLLGTDHTASLARMEAEHGVPVKLARMNPISMDGKLPPGMRVQKTIYEFLEPADEKDRGIILLGAYRPPAQDSELGRLIREYGFGPIRHPEYCADFGEYQAMARSAGAIMIRPEGKAAGEQLSKELGMPMLRAFMAFDRDQILENYRNIIAFLKGLDGNTEPMITGDVESLFSPAMERIARLEAEAREVLGTAAVAVDSTVTISPFSLALALVKSGINVNRIYTSQLPAHEKESLAELARLKGDIIVTSPTHIRRYGSRPEKPRSDIALGFEAGYATAAPVTVPLAFDEQMYGLDGYAMVLDAIIQFSRKGASDLREQVKEYGLVV
ncbi:nitrogenase component 1 [Breznakiella homolactica]|uniref:Nitrogenase/oxidoreductase component 1 domain-containing protein n=1 Tax=Breznakiella homolactica TaxID=2798577 RepID=A0A7T7XK40_9SPIR|nr:nitrogenase component 1 [Breznakiella homolactica]QQO07765.1 nitrogenase component 1 [Breznakiella homolactica]